MSALRKVTIERDGKRWKLVREHETGGETFYVDDLLDAFDTIDAAYRPDGSPRPWPWPLVGT
jgi:hypothetical protein